MRRAKRQNFVETIAYVELQLPKEKGTKVSSISIVLDYNICIMVNSIFLFWDIVG